MRLLPPRAVVSISLRKELPQKLIGIAFFEISEYQFCYIRVCCISIPLNMTPPALQTSPITNVKMNGVSFRTPTRQLMIPYNFHYIYPQDHLTLHEWLQAIACRSRFVNHLRSGTKYCKYSRS